MKPTVTIVYHFFAHYREPVIKELATSQKFQFEIISDDQTKTSIKALGKSQFASLSEDYRIRWVHVKNYWLGPLLWQRGVLKQAMRKDVHAFIFLGDAFFLSTWIASTIARLRGKRVLFWTHGLYGRESKPKLWFRLSFYRLASAGLLLYGDYAKRLLINNGFSPGRLYNIYNSLDYRLQRNLRKGLNEERAFEVRKSLFGDNAQLPIALFVGRLTEEKKLGLLVDAFLRLHADGRKMNLLLIGGGPAESDLRNAIPAKLRPYVKFYGACHDEELLAELIYASNVCVSPGNVGLTAIHSLVYGTPVVTHNDKRWQGPEFEAINDGVTGNLFARDNVPAMIEAMKNWLFLSETKRGAVRDRCFQIVDRFYNPAFQVRVIEQAIEGIPADYSANQMEIERF